MNPSIVSVAGSRDRVPAGVEPRNVDSRIAFHEARQLRSFGPYVAHLEQKICAERSLHVQIPILRVGQRQVRSQRQVGQRRCKSAVGRRVAVVGIGKIKKRTGSEADLLGLQIRGSADWSLQWSRPGRYSTARKRFHRRTSPATWNSRSGPTPNRCAVRIPS